jgi:hypothetical protein
MRIEPCYNCPCLPSHCYERCVKVFTHFWKIFLFSFLSLWFLQSHSLPPADMLHTGMVLAVPLAPTSWHVAHGYVLSDAAVLVLAAVHALTCRWKNSKFRIQIGRSISFCSCYRDTYLSTEQYAYSLHILYKSTWSSVNVALVLEIGSKIQITDQSKSHSYLPSQMLARRAYKFISR